MYRLFLICFSLLPLAGFAAELKVKVVDPHAAVVAGAQVSIYRNGSATPVAVRLTAGDGMARFDVDSVGSYQIEVLAAGFAPERADATVQTSTLTVPLRVEKVSETVVVSATRTPVSDETAGASVSTLEHGQIEAMRPVAASEALRFLPGAVVNVAGQRGGLGSLFVRGGDSRYNKILVDGVSVNEPGGTFDFGVVPLTGTERVEFLRGAQSTLYGSDAMTSVVQVFSQEGSTLRPELRFGADGGTFGTAHGDLALSGARGRLDYDVFGDQFNSSGQGPNDDYSNSLQGGNVGVKLRDNALFRFHLRHSNSRTGVQSFWNFNGQPLIPPDRDQLARQNNLIASADLTFNVGRWQHHFTGFDYNHKRLNEDTTVDAGRISPLFGNIDFPFQTASHVNRAGFAYQGDYVERSWARTTFGYEFEDENGRFGDPTAPPLSHGLRLNHALYGQQTVNWRRFSVVAGGRFVHNQTFGNKVVPRVAVGYQLWRGGQILSGTRLHFSYATGIKEPRFEESFANDAFTLPNPNLKAEENRAYEAGFQQNLLSGKYALTATYFHNRFSNQIDYSCCNAIFQGQYVNVNRSLAHGAEVEFKGNLTSRVLLDGSYSYTSTQILDQPFAFDPLLQPGNPLLRRPKHSASMLLNYLGAKWGGNVGGSFVGRRTDSDFLGFGVNHAAGYVRADAGGWYAITSRVTAYVNLENALNKHYEEVAGYPALRANFRAGLRLRLGGER